KITPTPVPNIPPETWLLGTSEKSAILAAEKGMDYAFGHFMTNKDGPDIVNTYREHFWEHHSSRGNDIIAVSVICADSEEEAQTLALSQFLWSIRQEKQIDYHRIPSLEDARDFSFSEEEKQKIQQMKEKMIIGNPKQVKVEMEELQELYSAEEMMVVTITHDEKKKFNSYRLLKKVFDINN